MSQCIRCQSVQIAFVNAKCSDLCQFIDPKGTSHEGYVPNDVGIGGGDYVEFEYCLHCGQIQGKFPVKFTKKCLS
jgi:hypothetical protein